MRPAITVHPGSFGTAWLATFHDDKVERLLGGNVDDPETVDDPHPEPGEQHG